MLDPNAPSSSDAATIGTWQGRGDKGDYGKHAQMRLAAPNRIPGYALAANAAPGSRGLKAILGKVIGNVGLDRLSCCSIGVAARGDAAFSVGALTDEISGYDKALNGGGVAIARQTKNNGCA